MIYEISTLYFLYKSFFRWPALPPSPWTRTIGKTLKVLNLEMLKPGKNYLELGFPPPKEPFRPISRRLN